MDDINAPVKLKIDREFKNLIRPLSPKEYEQLEANIVADGCRDPIVTWNGYIIDGHNRYEICRRHNIEFEVKEMQFDSRDDVIVWICSNQLGRRNITEETRKYLIGMQYETEKVINRKRNAQGRNQYTEASNPQSSEQPLFTGIRTAQRIAEENHIANGTVQKYGIYARALESIEAKCPELVPKILSGRYKVSHANVCELAKRTPDELKRISNKMNRTKTQFIKYSNSRTAIKGSTVETIPPPHDSSSIGNIKEMPVYDPDAEIKRLTLTIPSWTDSIKRTRSVINIMLASDGAKDNLMQELFLLEDEIKYMLNKLIGE